MSLNRQQLTKLSQAAHQHKEQEQDRRASLNETRRLLWQAKRLETLIPEIDLALKMAADRGEYTMTWTSFPEGELLIDKVEEHLDTLDVEYAFNMATAELKVTWS